VSPLEIQETEQDEITILAPRGSLEQNGAGELEERLERLMNEGRRSFVIDFRETEHVGSAGLRVLLMLQRKLASHRGAVALSGLNAEVRELAGFTRLFTVRATRAEAIGALPVSSRPARIGALAKEILIPGAGGGLVGVGSRDLDLEARTTLARKILNPQGRQGTAGAEESGGPTGKEGLLGKALGWWKKG
jgi:anti-anti-sigma factor